MELLTVYAFLVFQSFKTQIENIEKKNYRSTIYFVLALLSAEAVVWIAKYSELYKIQELVGLSVLDTCLFGIAVGFGITGAKDTINSLKKGE